MLQRETTFPYDVLDEIFCFACEGTPRRAMALSTVCKFWHDRIVENDRMWKLVLRDSRIRVGANWEGYETARAAFSQAAMFAPLRPETLHPIENYYRHSSAGDVKVGRCPMFLEGMTYVADGVSSCGACKENVYLVSSEEEFTASKRPGHYVLTDNDETPLLPEAVDQSNPQVAVVAPDLLCAEQMACAIVAAVENKFPGKVQRTSTIFPKFVVQANGRSISFSYRLLDEVIGAKTAKRGDSEDFSYCCIYKPKDSKPTVIPPGSRSKEADVPVVFLPWFERLKRKPNRVAAFKLVSTLRDRRKGGEGIAEELTKLFLQSVPSGGVRGKLALKGVRSGSAPQKESAQANDD